MSTQNVKDYLFSKLIEQATKIEKVFESECNNWRDNKINCKLMILGEAPLSFNKFFYNNHTGTYLSFLKQNYTEAKDLKNKDYIDYLRGKGIMNLDIYKYPLQTELYDKDRNLILFDSIHLQLKIEKLTADGIINSDTIFVYRYQKLLDRELYLKSPLTNIDSSNHIHDTPIAVGANAANLNPKLAKFLP